MAEVISPTIARRRVRLALRAAREAAELTQQQVAEKMEWSLSKVARIENGDVSIAPNDLRPLLSLVGIDESSRVVAMLADTRIARSRRGAWYETPEFRTHLSAALRRLVEYEMDAVAIRYYSIYYVPGVLQTTAYAETLLNLLGDELPRPEIRLRLAARQRRREALLTRRRLPKLFLLLDESVLHRPIGGDAVLAEQLRELIRLAQSGARIRMIPFSPEAPVTNNASFDLLSLGASLTDNMVLYHENGLSDELIEDPSTTERHRERYDKVWREATDEVDTLEFLGRCFDHLRQPPAVG
jgi:transcriptional regulator with XRE-family HTH domain